MGPFHPANKSALVAVTRGGLIRLVYQQPDGRWLEASAEIGSISSSVDLLTHASLCADKGTKHLNAVTGRCAEVSIQTIHCSLWYTLYPVNSDFIWFRLTGTFLRIQSRFRQRNSRLSQRYRSAMSNLSITVRRFAP